MIRSNTAHRRVWRYGPLIIWILVISFASTSEFSAANTSQIIRPILLWIFPNISEAQLANVHFLLRKAGHFIEYAVLAILARRAFISSSQSILRRYWFVLALLLVATYGLLDEFHQSFVPSRTSSIYDSGVDLAGGLTVLLLFKLYGNRTDEKIAAV